MTTPNTPAELAAMNKEPASPYDKPVVNAAMDALFDDDDSDPGDFQAVAERCIAFLIDVAESDLQRHSPDCGCADAIREAIFNLKAAEHFMEQAPFIVMCNPPTNEDA